MNVIWEKSAEENFHKLIGKVPAPMRGIAKDKISKKVLDLITKEARTEITEKDVVDAFFEATPFGFHGPMKCDMEAIGLDYTKYGYQR